MSYQVLARQWRPRTFEDLVGQEHVLRVLQNALSRQRLHHAYLFAGTRGVGKTTLARIFAKCLNCEQALSATPCGTCSTCRAIDAGQFLDLYEIDAASRTKVEDTRDLLDNVVYPPVQGRYKVYLIDEVHMLSGHSFNALLKTLEEPPPQVVFIFATTEPKRLPITILSRCLQFHLRQIRPEEIEAQLQRIIATEGIKAEEGALTLLAHAADGSLRDALSLLDQAIVYCDEKLETAALKEMLGYLTQDEIERLLAALADRDATRLFEIVAALKRRGPDYQQVLAELLSVIHQAAVFQQVPNGETRASVQALASRFTANELQLFYQITLHGQKDLPFAPYPSQGFEMTVLRLLAFHPLSLMAAPAKPAVLAQPKSLPSTPSSKPISTPLAPVRNGPLDWKTCLPTLGLTGVAYALALNCKLKNLSETQADFLLATSYKPMLNAKLVERIEQALTKHLGRPLRVQIELTEEAVHSPAKQQEQEDQHRRAEALEALQQNSGVQTIQALFNATLDTESIEVGS